MNKQIKSTSMWLDIINDMNNKQPDNNPIKYDCLYSKRLSKMLFPTNIQKYSVSTIPVAPVIPSYSMDFRQKTSKNFYKLKI